MRRSLLTIATVAALLAAAACGGVEDPALAGGAPGAEGSAGAALSPPPPPPPPTKSVAVEGVFMAERDYRKCAFPMCGGFWVWRVNQDKTTCPDGKTAEKCYVARINWDDLKLDPRTRSRVEASFGSGRAWVPGIIDRSGDPALRGVAEMGAYAAFEAATTKAPQGMALRVADTSIRCVRAPCFNIAVALLNTPEWGGISGVDLSGAGASSKQVAAAKAAQAKGMLLAAGDLVLTPVPGTKDMGVTLKVSQFYLRAVAGPTPPPPPKPGPAPRP